MSDTKITLPKVILPNRMEVLCLQKEEVFILYEQVQEYFKNGIEVKEGDTVFDVGANIGLFTLWVYELCNKNLNIFAFEPIPEIFQVLTQNVKLCNSEIKIFPYGIAHASKLQTFAYYPKITAISTAYPDGSAAERAQLKKAAMQKIAEIKHRKISSSPLYWYTKLPAFLLALVINYKLEKAFQVKQVTCQLKTLSEIIEEYKVKNIDLLKIDVEKSELDVLLGIQDEHWTKIKQIVLEVHDLNNRVNEITLLLKNHKFNVTVEQEQYLIGTDIFNIYATR